MSNPEPSRRPAAFRSVLFAPGNHPRRVERVFQCGADVAILDLEDAVAIAEKLPARAMVVAALALRPGSACYVRVNGLDTPWCYGDLLGVVGPGLDGIVLPKAESADQLRTVAWMLDQLERETGMPAGSVDLLPLIETARGVMNLESVATATPRVRRLAFGGGDYTNDLGLQWTEGEQELAFARARLVHCSRIAAIEAPIDTVLLQIRDGARFAASARAARGLGFQGKLCIHPDQVPLANAAFAPSAAEVEHARAVIAAFEDAERRGLASIQLGGQFVDYPIVHRARRLVALAARDGVAG